MSAIEVNSLGRFLVIGDLTFTTVPELHVRGCELIDASVQPTFAFGNVSSSDNAGVALLVSWARYARSVSKAIRFIELPKQLLDIIAVSGLLDVLPIKQ